MTQNEEIAKRFAQFRKMHIAKTQQEAANILGIGQATLSRFEAGTNPISIEVVGTLIKSYQISMDWLLAGKGRMVDKSEPAKANIVTDITEIKGDVQMLLKQVKMLQANYTFTVNAMNKKVDRQNERLEGLEKQLAEMKEYQRN